MSLFSTGTIAAVNTHVAVINDDLQQLGADGNPPFIRLIAAILSRIVEILLLMANDG